MTERLRQALLHIDELPTEAQEDVASHIEIFLDPEAVPQPTVAISVRATIQQALDLAGAWSDLPGDVDEFEVLDRMRHEAPPTSPIEDVE